MQKLLCRDLVSKTNLITLKIGFYSNYIYVTQSGSFTVKSPGPITLRFIRTASITRYDVANDSFDFRELFTPAIARVPFSLEYSFENGGSSLDINNRMKYGE